MNESPNSLRFPLSKPSTLRLEDFLLGILAMFLITAAIPALAQAPLFLDIRLETGVQRMHIHRLYEDRVVLIQSDGTQVELKPTQILGATNPEIDDQLKKAREVSGRIGSTQLNGYGSLLGEVEAAIQRMEEIRLLLGWLVPEAQELREQLEETQSAIGQTLDQQSRVLREIESVGKILEEGKALPAGWKEQLRAAVGEAVQGAYPRVREDLSRRLNEAVGRFADSVDSANRSALAGIVDLSKQVEVLSRANPVPTDQISGIMRQVTTLKEGISDPEIWVQAEAIASRLNATVAVSDATREVNTSAATAPPPEPASGEVQAASPSVSATTSAGVVLPSQSTPSIVLSPPEPESDPGAEETVANLDGGTWASPWALAIGVGTILLLGLGKMAARKRRSPPITEDSSVPSDPMEVFSLPSAPSSRVEEPSISEAPGAAETAPPQSQEVEPGSDQDPRQPALGEREPETVVEVVLLEEVPTTPGAADDAEAEMEASEVDDRRQASHTDKPGGETERPVEEQNFVLDLPATDRFETQVPGELEGAFVADLALADQLREGISLESFCPTRLRQSGRYFLIIGKQSGQSSLIVLDRMAINEEAFLVYQHEGQPLQDAFILSGLLWATTNESLLGFTRDRGLLSLRLSVDPPAPAANLSEERHSESLFLGEGRCVCYLPGNGLINVLTVSKPGTEEVDVRTLTISHTCFNNAVRGLVPLPHSGLIGVWTSDDILHAADSSQGRVLASDSALTEPMPGERICSLVASSDRLCILSRTPSGLAIIRCLAEGGKSGLMEILGPLENPRLVQTGSGFLLVSDRGATLWDDVSLEKLWEYSPAAGWIREVTVDRSELAFLLEGGPNRIEILGCNSGTLLWEITQEELEGVEVTSVALDQRLVLVCGTDREGNGLLKMFD